MSLLYFLESIRNPVLDAFFSFITKFGEETVFMVAALIIFWCINKYHGYGLGRKLFETAKNELRKLGYNKMIIACLKGNPTNEFYKYLGGIYVKDGLFERLQLPENIYYYDI